MFERRNISHIPILATTWSQSACLVVRLNWITNRISFVVWSNSATWLFLFDFRLFVPVSRPNYSNIDSLEGCDSTVLYNRNGLYNTRQARSKYTWIAEKSMSIVLTRRTSTKMHAVRSFLTIPRSSRIRVTEESSPIGSSERYSQRFTLCSPYVCISIAVSTNARQKSMRRIVSRMRSVAFRGLRAARLAPMLRCPGYFPFLSALWNQRARVQLSHLLGNASPASDIDTPPDFQHSARRTLDDSSLKCHKHGGKSAYFHYVIT